MVQAKIGGKIIFLNGPSSSGKSTIARALQAKLDEPFWHISIDHLRDAGVLPLARIRSGEFDWKAMREGFFEGFHLSLPSYARAGNNLIVEHIIETPAWRRRLIKLLEPYDVFFVGVHCGVEELERRESQRGNRPRGDARRDFGNMDLHSTYDLQIDGAAELESNVGRIISAWNGRSRPSAFERLAADV